MFEARGAVVDVLAETLVEDVEAVGVGHDVGNAGFDGGLDDLAVQVGRGTDGEGDDEELLAFESRDEGLSVVGVGDLGYLDAGR